MSAFGAGMGEVVAAEIPPELINLTRKVVRAFYNPIDAVVMDLLVLERCVKTTDIVSLIGVDQRHIQGVLSKLVKDQLVRKMVRLDNTAEQVEGEDPPKADYYFINYETLVNVVRLRIWTMQKNTKDGTNEAIRNRATMKCNTCSEEFSDLQVDQIMDFSTGMLTCDKCQGEVTYQDRDESEVHREKSKLNIQVFNNQLTPFTQLLADCKNITITLGVLEPEPTSKLFGAEEPRHRSSGLQRVSGIEGTEQATVIDFGDEATSAVKKAAPSFHSTAMFDVDHGSASSSASSAAAAAAAVALPQLEVESRKRQAPEGSAVDNSVAVMAALKRSRVEEPAADAAPADSGGGAAAAAVDDGGEDGDEGTTLTVNGEAVEFEDLTEEQIKSMTAEELEDYEALRDILEP